MKRVKTQFWLLHHINWTFTPAVKIWHKACIIDRIRVFWLAGSPHYRTASEAYGKVKSCSYTSCHLMKPPGSLFCYSRACPVLFPTQSSHGDLACGRIPVPSSQIRLSRGCSCSLHGKATIQSLPFGPGLSSFQLLQSSCRNVYIWNFLLFDKELVCKALVALSLGPNHLIFGGAET